MVKTKPLMTIVKERPASRSYGRGTDNYREPAMYAILNGIGQKVGVILGTNAHYMQSSSWTVNWLSPTGIPRTVHYADTLVAAKAWVTTWDGQPPERWRNEW